ncbi:hypothetical protein QBC47DRAFT_378385 [Echria macrotheca]|uniref:Uncharacterized protein n=1 Tax=Echria macrotheca TaxID=438768 RepID=A0AAJ0BJK7_9PEZI|nr:hypothetical protein QBC47DRAFT_378385 [Echria macrotheca]
MASEQQQAPSCPASRGNAMQFIQEVQARFATQPEFYQRFLQAFTEIYSPGNEPKTAEEGARVVQEKMGDIFVNDKDLLEKFQSFLPHNQQETVRNKTQDLAAELDAEEVD